MIKDNLTPFVPVVATDPFHVSTLSTRLSQLITRDEELALLLGGISTSAVVSETTTKHELVGDKTVTPLSTQGWLTRIPAYYRNGRWTGPITFKDTYSNGAGLPIVYPSDSTQVIYGTLTTTYTVSVADGSISNRPRSPEELQYGDPSAGTPNVPLGRMYDGSTAYGAKILNPDQAWIYVKKADDSIIILNTFLPFPVTNYMKIMPCADQRHIMVWSSVTTEGVTTKYWFLLEYTGSGGVLTDYGTIDPSVVTSQQSIGYSDQLGTFTIAMVESDLRTVWTVYCPATGVYVLRIDDSKVLRTVDSFPLSYGESTYFNPGFWHPAIHADNGQCNFVCGNQVLKLSRSPSLPFNLTSGYLQFNGTTSLISTTANTAVLNFGTEDFCIELVVEADVLSSYTLLSTNLWSVRVTEANPGPGQVEFSGPAPTPSAAIGVVQGKPINITIEKFAGVISIYLNGWKKTQINNTASFGTPTYLKIGGDAPIFKGKLYYCRISSVARYKGEFQINEFVPGAGDSNWANTQFLLQSDTGTLYKRRELLDSRGKLPVDWEVSLVGEGTYVVNHDLGVSNFSVVPMAFTPGVKITTSNYTSTTFQVNTFSLNGSSRINSDFSCMVFLG